MEVSSKYEIGSVLYYGVDFLNESYAQVCKKLVPKP